MRHASLFSGIGGPEVAAAMLGWENVFHCEINEFGRKVLEYWFPNSESYEDITKTDFRKFRGTIDVLTGGFPCQPFSYAGKRGGSKTSAISGRKCSELLTKSGRLGLLVKMLLESEEQRDKRNEWNACSRDNEWICGKERLDFTDSDLQRCNESKPTQEPRRKERFACEENIKGGIRSLHPKERWTSFPTISAVHRGNDGIPFDVDKLAISIGKWRTESIKAYGNAIVPQVMYRIFEAIEALENDKAL